MPSRVFLTLVLCFAKGVLAQNCDQPGQVPCDVQVGTPVATAFSRAFPLLDGLYQDLAAMQVAPLNVSPSGPNGASLDVVLQQFQASLQYSTGLGIQNSVAGQQAATASANFALQNTLIGNEQQLYSQLQAAQKDADGKQQALLGLAADDSGRRAAQTALDQANATVTSLQNQLATVQKLVTISAPTSTSFSSPAPGGSTSTPPTTTLATPTPTPALATPDKFVPSFPAYKQMEVQAALLRERLAKLVSVLSQQAHFADSNLHLVEFHAAPLAGKPGVVHKHRKGKMLNVEYVIQGCSQTEDAKGASVVDLFPRNAAVNISNEKYRDSRLGISFLWSLFSFGLNAAYNREHLQISQALSESAYITGFGITRSRFGWTYGLALGEDTLAPGDRETFALIATPKACTHASVALARAVWSKDPPQDTNGSAEPILAPDRRTPLIRAVLDDGAATRDAVKLKAVRYSQIQYDPTDKTSKPVALVKFEFDPQSQIDSEATLTVNGAVVKRARDKFFRGTTVPSGADNFNGLLEASSFDADTWIPLGPNEFAISLNAAALPSGGFPRILMSVPGRAPLDLTAQMKDDTSVEITVAGRRVVCSDVPCAPLLPPLALPKPSGTSKTITASRFCVGSCPEKGQTMISITVDDTSGQARSSPSGVQLAQLIAASDTQKWGTPIVLAEGRPLTPQSGSSPPTPPPPETPPAPRASAVTNDRSQHTTTYALHCTASGAKLECPLPAGLAAKERISIAVTDANYSGGTVLDLVDLEACVTCYLPLPRRVEDPVWDSVNGGKWLLRMSLDNIGNGELDLYDTLDNNRKKLLSTSKVHCNTTTSSASCDAVFEIGTDQFASLTDDMSIGFVPQETKPTETSPVGSARILYLRQLLQPVLTQFKPTPDHASIRLGGKNLFFDYIRIGNSKSGAKLVADCPAAVTCSITGGSKKLTGYAYFCADSMCAAAFPLLLADDKGVLTPAWLDKVAADENNATPPAPPPPNSTGPTPNAANSSKSAVGGAVTNLDNAAGTLRLYLNRHLVAGQNR